MERRNKLLFSNVDVDCSGDDLTHWIEARGYKVLRVTLIRDLVSGTSPSFAYVQLMNEGKLDEARRALNGQPLRRRNVQVNRVMPLQAFDGSMTATA